MKDNIDILITIESKIDSRFPEGQIVYRFSPHPSVWTEIGQKFSGFALERPRERILIL